MDQQKWDTYLQKDKIPKIHTGMQADGVKNRTSDLDFCNQFTNFQDKKVLDIGCENGLVLKYLKDKYNCDIHGVTLGEYNKEENPHIKIGDMHELPFEDSSFDVVLCLHTLEHSIAPYIVLSEIKRVLKDEGIAVIIAPEEGDLWTTTRQHYSVMTFRQIFNLFMKLRFVPIMNFRKDFEINVIEMKRDMICLWYNSKEEPESLEGMGDVIIPIKGKIYHYDHKVSFTPILVNTYMDGKGVPHFLGRTDSLKLDGN